MTKTKISSLTEKVFEIVQLYLLIKVLRKFHGEKNSLFNKQYRDNWIFPYKN